VLCDEEDPTNFKFSYKTFNEVNIALPESDSDNEFCSRNHLDDRHENNFSSNSADNAYSYAEQRVSNVTDSELSRREGKVLLPQATTASDDTRVVLCAPEIEIDFDDEPVIEITSYC